MGRQWIMAGLRLTRKALGLALAFSAFAGVAQAAPLPEMDPTSMSGAAALLAGGVLLLTDRLRRK